MRDVIIRKNENHNGIHWKTARALQRKLKKTVKETSFPKSGEIELKKKGKAIIIGFIDVSPVTIYSFLPRAIPALQQTLVAANKKGFKIIPSVATIMALREEGLDLSEEIGIFLTS